MRDLSEVEVTNRQRAILQYAVTVAQDIRGFKSERDALNRIVRCVREDAVFFAQGFAVEGVRRLVEKKFGDLLGAASRKVFEVLRK